MSDTGDHVPQMPATPLLDDDTIDALVEGRPVADQHASLAVFAQAARAAGEGPPPPRRRPLPGCCARACRARTVRGLVRSLLPRPQTTTPPAADTWSPRRPASASRPRSGWVTAAAATVVGAGAGGLLPDRADRVVREAIEVVTPFGFGDDGVPGGRRSEDPGPDGTGSGTSGADPDGFGEDVSSDATGESDGEPGVDGQDIADEAPGATNRPSDDPGSGTPVDPAPPVTTGGPPGFPTPPVTTGPPPDVPGRGRPGCRARSGRARPWPAARAEGGGARRGLGRAGRRRPHAPIGRPAARGRGTASTTPPP